MFRNFIFIFCFLFILITAVQIYTYLLELKFTLINIIFSYNSIELLKFN